MRHLKYLKYVLLHKWYVFTACLWLGVPIRGIFHDLSKFQPVEWFAYANFFYGGWRLDNYNGESKAPPELKHAYDIAWNHHMKANDHHWQYWVMVFDSGETKALQMPDAAMREMLADWIGAGRAQGKPETWDWYEANKDKMLLHPVTRFWIEKKLAELKEYNRRLNRFRTLGL